MGSKSSTPAPVKPQESAQDVLNAQLNTLPRAQQLSFDLMKDPNTGLLPTTQLQQDVRQQVFGEESSIKDALAKNVLSQLLSPTGISPEQQSAIDARRGTAQDELVRAQRTRANLGGGLFGGRAGRAEEQGVSQLQQAFAEEDINRETLARQQAIQSALPFLQILFPEIGLSMPQFASPVASGDTALQAGSQQRGQDMSYQAQQEASRSAMLSSLFRGLGTAAGGALGAGGILGQAIK